MGIKLNEFKKYNKAGQQKCEVINYENVELPKNIAFENIKRMAV